LDNLSISKTVGPLYRLHKNSRRDD